MELREKIAHLKSQHGLTTELLSARSGVPVGTINKLLNGETKNPTARTLQKLADALGCPFESLITRALPDNILPIESRRVPVLGAIAAGKPIYASEENDCYIACDAALRCDFALRVQGDSMTGARISDGDIVFIRSQPDVENGEIAAVVIDDEATLKRVYHLKNGLQLLSENPKYPPMIFTFEEHENILILGKAVAFQSRL